MRYLVIIALMCASLLAEKRVILSGFAYHGEKENKVGRPYDYIIEGIGFQYRIPHDSFEYSATALVISDSNSNVMYTGTLGAVYNMFYNVNIGVEVGIGSRMIYAVDDSGHKLDYRVRNFIPVALPKLEVDFGRIMVNISYIPAISMGSIGVPEVLYVNFGIKI